MEQAKIDRINELARRAKNGALTTEETAERDALRVEYLHSWREATLATLENTYIERPDGTREKLKRRGE